MTKTNYNVLGIAYSFVKYGIKLIDKFIKYLNITALINIMVKDFIPLDIILKYAVDPNKIKFTEEYLIEYNLLDKYKKSIRKLRFQLDRIIYYKRDNKKLLMHYYGNAILKDRKIITYIIVSKCDVDISIDYSECINHYIGLCIKHDNYLHFKQIVQSNKDYDFSLIIEGCKKLGLEEYLMIFN